MHSDQPPTHAIRDLMQRICIRNTIYGCIHRQSKKQNISYIFRARGYARDHFAAGEGLDEDEIGHYGEDVVVGGERGEPVDGEVVGPDEEDHDVDG